MIRVEHASLTIDGRRILEDVDLQVARGESVAIVGANGSGKTSVLRCLLGLVPFTGQASIDGFDVVREPIEARSRVGYVPQKVAFGDALAGEVLTFVARLRGIPRARIPSALRDVGLAERANQRVRTFSGGMQQRLAIAVALLASPPVLLLDEPSASLDQDGQKTFFELVQRLRDGDHTLLLASHRGDEVAGLTDRTICLDGGRVVPEPAAGASVPPRSSALASTHLRAPGSSRPLRLATRGSDR